MTKAEIKELADNYRRQTEYIRRATAESIFRETDDARERRIKRLLMPENYGEMFNYYFGKNTPVPMADCDCAPYHINAYNDLYYNAFITVFNFVFRGGAKSTHANLGYMFALKQTERSKFSLVTGVNELRAKMLLSDLQAQLEANTRIAEDFGKQVQYGSWADGQFETTDRATFMALGIEQPFRGLRKNGVRLQYVSIDDVEDPKRALNPRIIGEITDKITGDIGNAFHKDTKRMIVNNNFFTDKGIMAELMKRKGVPRFSSKENLYLKDKFYSLFLVNLTDRHYSQPDWRPSWKRFSKADCRRIIEEHKHDIPTLEREMYNTPVEVGKLFKAEWIRFVEPKPLSGYSLLIGHWDFSYSATGDTKAFALIGVDGLRLTVLDVFCRRCDMEDALAYHFTNANIRYRENAGTIYYYDASVAQKAIFEPILFRAASQYKSIYIPLPEHSQTDKYIRIEATLTSALSSGKVVFSNKLKENPDWEEARLQLLGFEKGAKLNDDFPDTLEACVRLSQDYAVSDDQVFTPVIGNGEREGY